MRAGVTAKKDKKGKKNKKTFALFALLVLPSKKFARRRPPVRTANFLDRASGKDTL
jgi:hypothetical protein